MRSRLEAIATGLLDELWLRQGDEVAGPHFCPGSRVARLAAAVALPALFGRFPGLTLAVQPDQVEPSRSFIANSRLRP